MLTKTVLDAIRQLGSVGGKKAAKNMSKTARTARAKKAAAASVKVRQAKAAARRKKEGK
jgi:hypothetical protein